MLYALYEKQVTCKECTLPSALISNWNFGESSTEYENNALLMLIYLKARIDHHMESKPTDQADIRICKHVHMYIL